MSYMVRIDYGTGWIELTDWDGEGTSILKKHGLSKTEILHDDDGESVINTCSFRTDMPTVLASALINLDVETQILIDIDEDGVNWFTGYARPVTDFAVKASGGFLEKEIEWEGVDNLWALKKVLSTGISYPNYKVCDPADTANSIVHQLLLDAGVASGDINIAVTISTVLPVFSANANDQEYFELLSELLSDYGCSINAAADGAYYVNRWADPNVPDAGTLSTWPVSERNFRTKRNDVDQERVQVKWRKVNSKSQVNLRSIPGDQIVAFGHPNAGFGEPIHEWPPDGATDHPIDQELSNGDKIASFSNVTLKTYLSSFRLYNVNFGSQTFGWNRWHANSAFAVSGERSNITFSGQLMDVAVTPDYAGFSVSIQYQPREHIPGVLYPGTALEENLDLDVSEINIGEYRIYADIETIGERWTSEVGTGDRLVIRESDYIFSEADAEALAEAIHDLKTISSKTFLVRVDEDVPVGTYRRLTNAILNIDLVIRVKRKVDSIADEEQGYKVYRYEVEAAEPLSQLFTSVSGGTFAIQPTPSEVQSGSAAANEGLLPSGQIVKAVEARLLEEGFTPEESDLYLSSDFLGFYNAVLGLWASAIKNDGSGRFTWTDDTEGEQGVYWGPDARPGGLPGMLIKATLEVLGDSILRGKVQTGDGIESDNYVAGESGWRIDGDGNGEFQDIIVRNESVDGLWRLRFEGSEVVVEKNEGGSWTVVSRFGGEGYQATYFTSKGVLHPNRTADDFDIGLRAPEGSSVYDMEGDYEDKQGVDPWSTKTNLVFDAVRYKLGAQAVKHSGAEGVLARALYPSLKWSTDLAVAFWFYRAQYAGPNGFVPEITDIQFGGVANNFQGDYVLLERVAADSLIETIAIRFRVSTHVSLSDPGTYPLSAQQTQWGLHLAPDGVAMAGDNGGNMVRSTDAGLTWAAVANPHTGYVNGFATDEGGVWVMVGSDPVVDTKHAAARSSDNGASWSAVTVPHGGSTGDYRAVATDRNGVWVIVGVTGRAARSTDNGVTWASISIPTSEALESVATDRNGKWIVVGYSGGVFESTDNGATWSSVYTAGGALRAVATDESGSWVAVGNGGRLLYTTDDGTVWNENGTFFGATRVGLATNGKGTWVASGVNGEADRTVSLGSTWSSLGTGTTEILWAVTCDRDGKWLINGSYDTLLRSDNTPAAGSEDVTYVVELLGTETADEMATKVLAVIDDSALWTISQPSTDTLRITNANDGNVTDVSQSGTTFTLTVVQQGFHPNIDPPVLLFLEGTMPLETVEILQWYPSSLRLRVNGVLGAEIASNDDAWNMLWLYHTGGAGLTLWLNGSSVVDNTALSGTTDLDLTLGLDADWYDVSIDELIVNTQDTLSASLINDYYTGGVPWSEDIDYAKDLLLAAAPGGVIHMRSPIYDESGELISSSSAPPIGAQIIQFPGKSDPNTLWPGTTWQEILDDDAYGLFFRTKGSYANPFDGTVQGWALQSHAHSMALQRTYGGGTYREAIYWYTAYNNKNTSATGSAETRPRNVTIQIWERIA